MVPGAENAPTFRGVGTAIVTPLTAGGLDLDALTRLVEFQIAGGVDFLVPCGTTGESPTLTDRERVQVIEHVVEVTAGRVPIVAGTGTNDTPHSVAMTREARRVGATACLAVSPYYNRPTQEGLYRHFRAMIDDGGLPAILYHIPSRGSSPIEVETVARVAAGGGVAGIKETGGVGRVSALRLKADVEVLSGDDGLTLPMLALGAAGVVSVASNVVPSEMALLVERAAAGDFDGARAVHERLLPVFEALFVEPNPIPVKAALQLAGHLADATVRLPLVDAAPATRALLEAALATLAAPV